MPSFLFLSRPREHRNVHFSLGDSGWVKLQPSSSERATFASPFCLESGQEDKNTCQHKWQSCYRPEGPHKGRQRYIAQNWYFSVMKSSLTEMLGEVI